MYKEIISSIDQISKKIWNDGRNINILAFFLIIFPFFIERLIVGEEFYSNNLRTAVKGGKMFK